MKRGNLTGSSDVHNQCWELLPWIANERAAAADAALVEAHLRDCADCQVELEAQRRLRDAIRSEDCIVLAPQTSLQKLMQRIEDESAVDRAEIADSEAATSSYAEPTDHAPAALVHRTKSGLPRWLSIAAAVQGITIIALLSTLWMQSRDTLTAPRYTTLTSPTPLIRGPVLRVVFAESVTLDEVNEILRSIDAQIIAGPSEAGVYTLALPVHAAGTGPIADALARLRSDDRILFSESALSESP
jgi:hypothetical protein